MTYWSMKTHDDPGYHRRNGDSGKLLSYVFQALFSGLPSSLISLWSVHYSQRRIANKVWHRLDQYFGLQKHPRIHPTIPIATTPYRDPAVSSLGDC